MMFPDRTPVADRVSGALCSIAVHLALGLALIWPFAGPRADRQSAAVGERILIVELLPLSPGSAVSDRGDRELVRPAEEQVAAALPSAGQQGRHQPSPAVAGGAPEKGLSREQGATQEAAGNGSADGAPAASAAAAQIFRSQLLRHIERYRRYPSEAQAGGVEGVVQVHFIMTDKGEVSDIWIEMSSGSKELDDEAIAAILRARPLPSPPPHWPNSFAVTLPIGFSLR